ALPDHGTGRGQAPERSHRQRRHASGALTGARDPIGRCRQCGAPERDHTSGSHSRHGSYLERIGRVADAIAEGKQARELEPLSLIINSVMGRSFYYARQYDRAIGEFGKSLEMDPNFAQTHMYLGWAYEQQA